MLRQKGRCKRRGGGKDRDRDIILGKGNCNKQRDIATIQKQAHRKLEACWVFFCKGRFEESNGQQLSYCICYQPFTHMLLADHDSIFTFRRNRHTYYLLLSAAYAAYVTGA